VFLAEHFGIPGKHRPSDTPVRPVCEDHPFSSDFREEIFFTKILWTYTMNYIRQEMSSCSWAWRTVAGHDG
jgi:hypothetical protein